MSLAQLDRVLDNLPNAYPGPGGAVAVLKEGKLFASRTWGWADVERRLPFTPQTLFRVCSISKQFTCAAMLDNFADTTALDADVAAQFPRLTHPSPTARHLADNQSGLRDYWATAMLCGATVERPFGDAEAGHLIGLTASLQFAPGTRFSYCNQNFRILGDIIASRTGRTLNELMQKASFGPAGMATARLVPNTETMPDGTIGYEGSVEAGFRPAVNRIFWTGDAGLAASLTDMIAWDSWIDSVRDNPAALYTRQSAQPHFADGTDALYGFGLGQVKLCGRTGTGHGGGLRGWRSFRCYLPSERVSIIALFNHMDEPRAATQKIAEALFDHPPQPKPAAPAIPWQGNYEEPETSLSVRLETTADNTVKLTYSGRHAEQLNPKPDDTATAGTTTLRRTEAGIWMDRGGDHQSSHLVSLEGTGPTDLEGRFHCTEYDATLTCVRSGGAIYAAFSGFLGDGMMHILLPAGPDMWRMPMPRALDDSPPGDWTIKIHREADKITALTIGCWLARNLKFTP